MSPIYKTPSGPYIDLDRLLSIGNIHWSSLSKGNNIEFLLTFQLQNAPLTLYVRTLIDGGSIWKNGGETRIGYIQPDGKMSAFFSHETTFGCINRDYVVPILNAWQEWKTYKGLRGD